MSVDTTSKTRCVLYARFSPRPIPATCDCGHQFRVEAGEKEKILAICPVCKSSLFVKNCESCESQLAELRQYCWKRGYEIAAQFSDRALSGGDDWDERAGMMDAEATCKRGYLFLVRSYDRLFRDADKATHFIAVLNARGVEVRSITEEAANGSEMHAKLIRFIVLWHAELERQKIRARTRAKMRQYQEDGRRMSATPPYGFDVDPENPAKLVRNATEQSYIKTIKDLHRQGLKLRTIARWLEENGVKRRGKDSWTHQLVKAILRREGVLKEAIRQGV